MFRGGRRSAPLGRLLSEGEKAGGNRVSAQLESLAADRIGADAAFSALDASGAPVFAATIEPPKIVYLNASARAAFGGAEAAGAALFDTSRPGGSRLVDLAETMLGEGAAPGPRIERIELLVGGTPHQVAVLCRRMSDARGPSIFVFSGLGLRGAADGRGSTFSAPPDPAALALRGRLVARCGGETARFLWKTDANGRFIACSSPITEPVEPESDPVLGRTAAEIAQAHGLDPAFVAAFGRETGTAHETSWRDVAVDWPLFDATGRVIGLIPATLGALRLERADRTFAGYNGYGVLRLDAVRALAAPATPVAGEAASDAFDAANVVRLRPPSPVRDALTPEPMAEAPATDESAAALTPTERSAFDEIGRTLGGESDAPASADVAASPVTADGPESVSSRAVAATLDLLPLPVLVARGARALFVNRALLETFGCADRAAFDACGGLAAFFMPAATGADDRALTDVAAAGGDARVEAIEWDGAPATMIAILRRRRDDAETNSPADGQESRNAIARLRVDNTTLRAVVDALDGAVAVIDEDGRISSASVGFSSLFDRGRGETDGLSLLSLFATEDASGIAAALAQARPGESATVHVATRAGRRPLEAVIGRLPVAETRLFMRLRAPVVVANAEVEAARRAAEAASAAKSDFLARIGHEIRTPLNAIIGFAEVMMEERLGPIGQPRYKDYLRDMRASGAHVLSLVNDLLDLSKIEAGKMQLDFAEVDVNAVIAECVSIMQTQANRERVVIRQALAASMPRIQADLRALRQILLNLLSNAVKFNQPGGQIIVSTGPSEAGCVVIRVKDTGIGMSEAEVQSALEPFTQIAPGSGVRGTGLGLPLTKALVEASHASLTIRSRKQEGTLVEIAFPLSVARAAE